MKAFQIEEYAHPSKITPSEIDVPRARAEKGEVLVDVHAAGLNFFDILQAQGNYQTQPPMPFTLGAELAGTVSSSCAIPKGCPYKAGDRVFGYAQGSFADHVVAQWRNLMPIPDNLSFEEAATIPLTYTTSYQALVGRANAQPNEWVLVHAAAGGVGLAACQIAKMLGCKVVAAASSDEKRRVCVERGGADEVIDYTKDGWQKEVMRLTEGKGVDIVFDPVGLIVPSLKCVAWGARVLVIGFAAGTIEKIPANLLLLKSVSVVGVYWGGMATKDIPGVLRTIKAILKLLSAGTLRPVLYPVAYRGIGSVSAGLGDIEGRQVWGKAVVRIREGDTTTRGEKGTRAKL